MQSHHPIAKQTPCRTRTRDREAPTSCPQAPSDPTSTVESHVESLEARFEVLKAQVRQAQQLASLGGAAAMIAHEVSNLLTPIQSYAQTALESDDPALQKKALRVTLKNAQMLAAMSERVLEIGAAKPPVRQAVSIHTAAHDAVESLCRDLSKDGISLSVEVDQLLTVWADPLQLAQVLFNLFLNARNAMASMHQGRLVVTAARRQDRVVLKVADTGPGIPADLLANVFDPLQTSKPIDRNGRQRCAGLGLALCRDLVEENGGTINVTSKAGVGTTFTIILPAGNPAE